MASSFSPKPLTLILAPYFVSAIAIPKPIPLVEPITKAVLPFNVDISFTVLSVLDGSLFHPKLDVTGFEVQIRCSQRPNWCQNYQGL
jgi:hypothetical protein